MSASACRKRTHAWDKTDGAGHGVPGARCLHCPATFKGGRGSSVLPGPSRPPPPAPAPTVAPPPAASAPAPFTDELAARRAKLAARFGAAPAPALGTNNPGPEAAPAAVPGKLSVLDKTTLGSLADWLGPLLPAVVIKLEQKAIEKRGYEPADADPIWREKFEQCTEALFEDWLPSIEMTPGWGALLCSGVLLAQMAIGGKKLPPKLKEDSAPAPETAPAKAAATATVAPAPESAPATKPEPKPTSEAMPDGRPAGWNWQGLSDGSAGNAET